MSLEHVQLDFEKQIFIELISEDGLVVLARGLGLDRIFLNFLRLYCDPHHLVLVINTSQPHEEYFIEELVLQGVEYVPKCVTNEITAKEREVLYLKGGVLFVTSRILVVDLLRRQCPADKVAGILVFNAHRVTETSTEAFIIRLYREANKDGFVKAFTDYPAHFTTGFAQLEKVMRNLLVTKVFLWPRFHAVVSSSLERHKPDVVELRQQMTPAMTAVQMAVLEIMKACVLELKSSNPSLDTDDVTVEVCLSKALDQVIKKQLDPVWDKLTQKTKQLVFDLKMLRSLLYFLIQYDCVTFLSYLDSLRSDKGSRAFSDSSPWLFMGAANTLFVKARERVYGDGAKKGARGRETLGNGGKIEESPKWHLLKMVLEEIQKERQSSPHLRESQHVLVLASDERTCYQLRQYLSEGGQELLSRQFDRLLATDALTRVSELPAEMRKEIEREKCKTREGKGIKRPTDQAKPAGKKPRAEVEVESAKAEGEEEVWEKADLQGDVFPGLSIPEEDLGEPIMVASLCSVPSEQATSNFELLPAPMVILHSLSSSSNSYHLMGLLRDIRPNFVVMYDADVKCVRQLEVFKASHPGMPLRVYFLLYDSSVEEQKYLTSLRKEKEAFQQLIRQKARMVLPTDRELQLKRREPAVSSSTRKAGGRGNECATPTVVVDMREFRSSLPSLLHKRGMDVFPLTLEVGDYVLSPEMCVERKSISDLIGSINSGRLFNQVTAMTRWYKRPLLLIEVEEGRPFSLQWSGDASSKSLGSKLALLTIHFPKLRILWCSSAHVTAKLFEQLKVGQAEPVAAEAVAVGSEGERIEAGIFNPATQDFLLKMPGVNSKNYRTLMSKVSDFQEMAKMSKSQLISILENKTNAEMLWNFLHTDHTHARERGLERPKASSSGEAFHSKKILTRTNQGGKGRRQQKKF